MELTYNELRKREVINVTDGRSLGRITDVRFDFPEGVIVGIYVPGRRLSGIFRIFDKTTIYIDESKIIKIGGDVILVDLKCGEVCSPSTRRDRHPDVCVDKPINCPPPCPPQCPPPRPPQGRKGGNKKGGGVGNGTGQIFGQIESEEEDEY